MIGPPAQGSRKFPASTDDDVCCYKGRVGYCCCRGLLLLLLLLFQCLVEWSKYVDTYPDYLIIVGRACCVQAACISKLSGWCNTVSW